MEILIDRGELSLLRIAGKYCTPKSVKLPIGDMLIVNNTGSLVLERKTVRDFIGSVRSNRLWNQLLEMMKVEKILGYEVKRRLLVIEGGLWQYASARASNEDKFWSTTIGSLLAVNFEYDTPCIVCENNPAFETFIRILLQREEKGKNDRLPKGRWPRKSPSRLPIKDSKLFVLDAIPTIGEERAKKLLEFYGSISNVATSDKVHLMKVPGIGEKRAQKIYEIFH